ncbi:MAG: GNAT family N-acetyltransferase, partial [Mesorhizobium sp.]
AFARLGFHETARTAHSGYDRPTSITMRKVLS